MKLLVLALLAAIPQDDARLRTWVDQLGALYESERKEAREQLVAAGASAEKHLVKGLEHADHRVRKGCLELLGKINAPSGVDKASEIFRSKTEDRSVQAAAFEYLKLHGAKAEDVLIEALDNTEETYRAGAVDALTAVKSAKALPKAAALFERETVKAIKDKIFTLLKSAGDQARPYFLKFLTNADASIRQEALSSLIELQTPPEDMIEPVTKLLKMEVNDSILRDAFGVFARAGEKANPHLLEALRSPTPAVRRTALDAVAKERTEGVLEGVAELYHRETDDLIRKDALAYLEGQGLRAEPALIKALDSPIAKVRMEAIPALGKIKSEKVFDRVAALYKNEKDLEVRTACFKYLLSVGIRAEAELIVAMNDDDPAIRQSAILALAAAGSVKAIAPLAEILKDDKSPMRQIAVDALATIGEKAVEYLKEGVKANRVRESDAKDVIGLVDLVAVERMLDAMVVEDSTGVTTGTWSGQFDELFKLGRERVLPVLWKMAGEPEYSIRWRDGTKTAPRYATYLQCLAILAIGELGDASQVPRLQGLSFSRGEDRHREQLVALHRLGEKKLFETFAAEELKDARVLLGGDERLNAYPKLFNVALLQSRVGLKEEALKTYKELVEAVEKAKHIPDFQDVSSAYYNIACIHAGAGRKAEAVAALGRAIEAGFGNFEWIFKDKDLDPIRNEEGYKKLTAEALKSRPK